MLVVRPGHVPQNQSTKILQHILCIPVFVSTVNADLPLPSSPQSDIKLICQMSSRLYTLAHRFPTISNQFAALLESLLSTKKTLLFFPSMIHVPSALTVDSCLLKKFLNYKLSSLSDLYLRYHTISETMVFCWESPSTLRER